VVVHVDSKESDDQKIVVAAATGSTDPVWVMPAAMPLAVSNAVISENPYFLRSSRSWSILSMAFRQAAISSNGSAIPNLQQFRAPRLRQRPPACQSAATIGVGTNASRQAARCGI
jgi:hypothetical protein